MPTRDASLPCGPSTVPLVANGNSTVVEVEGTPLHGLAVQLNVMATGVSTVPTLTAIVHASTGSTVTTDDEIVGQSPAILTAGEYIIPFTTEKRYILVEYALTGAATDSPNFSDAQAYVVENVGHEWSRLVNFH